MRGIASSQISPGTQTCVIVGSLDGVADLDLSVYRNVLWFTGKPAFVPTRLGAEAGKLWVEDVLPPDPARTASAVNRLIQRDTLRLPSVFLTEKAARDTTGSFLPVVETILTQCETHLRARATRQQVGFLWQNHLLANLPAFAQHRLPRAWSGVLAGVPAFVCGSGPSLDTSGAKLAEVAHHGVVFAADSALAALDRLGVEVDFAVSVDATKTPEKCLGRGRTPSRLIAASISPPAWRQAVPEERVSFLSGNQVTEDWLAPLGVTKTAIGVQGNCGITAVELAIELGCEPIYLFGMDNAVDGHGSGRLHQQQFDSQAPGGDRLPAEANYPKVPGNYQEEIATPFLREWRLLDQRCAQLAPGRVLNVTDRGARLRNTTLVHPDRFSPSGEKAAARTRLAQLPPAEPIGHEQWTAIVKAVQRAAQSGTAAVDDAKHAIQRGNTHRAVKRLTHAFQDRAFSALMGSYGLKVMPHLLQPDEDKPEFWRTLVDECETLVALAKRMA